MEGNAFGVWTEIYENTKLRIGCEYNKLTWISTTVESAERDIACAARSGQLLLNTIEHVQPVTFAPTCDLV